MPQHLHQIKRDTASKVPSTVPGPQQTLVLCPLHINFTVKVLLHTLNPLLKPLEFGISPKSSDLTPGAAHLKNHRAESQTQVFRH